MEYRNNISAIDSNMDTPVISTVQLPMTESLDALNFSNPYPMAKSAGNTQQDVDENEKCNAAWPQMKKKRRMSVEQTRSLEKIFEVENKLQPERKSQIALELGLPPRQVTVWFQNKRARCKTKDLEKDYNLLKSNYDDLRSSFEALQRENEKLATELNCLKEKLEESEKAGGHNHDLMTDSCPENGRSVSGYGIDNSIGDTSSEMRLNGKSEGSLRNQISGYVSTSSQYCYNAQQLPLWDWP